jgi:glucose dehydrogenase
MEIMSLMGWFIPVSDGMVYSSGLVDLPFVAIAAGGHGKLGTRQGDYVLAFTLP